MKITDFLSLLFVAIQNIALGLLIKLCEFGKFGRFFWWWKLQFILFYYYFLDPPYSIVRRNLAKIDVNEESLIYGETPLITVENILFSVGVINKDDIFIDLGSGRGLTVFYTSLCYGIPCIGFDIIPEFIDRSNKIARFLRLGNVKFINADFNSEDFSKGTIIYLAGTTFDDESIRKISDKLSVFSQWRKIISLSQPLPIQGYGKSFSKPLTFTWGKTMVYFQEKKL